MVDKSSELWECKNVDSMFEKSLCDAEVCGLKVLGIDQSCHSSQSQACKGTYPACQHLVKN